MIDSTLVLVDIQTTKPQTYIKHIKHRLNGEERLYPVDEAMWDRQAVLKGVSVSPVTSRVEMGIKVIVPAFISYLIIVQRFFIIIINAPPSLFPSQTHSNSNTPRKGDMTLPENQEKYVFPEFSASFPHPSSIPFQPLINGH